MNLEPYAAKLKRSSPQGTKPISREALLRALLVAPQEGISTFTLLHHRLDQDLWFRYPCGFRLDEPAPSIATLSRVFKSIVDQGLAKTLFVDLVAQCKEAGIVDGQHLAIDSTAIDAYEKKQPKKRNQTTGNATWGAKNDTFGNKLTWFGYKIHLAVDTHSELPVALAVTPANEYDGEMAVPLMNEVMGERKWQVKFVMMDAGYDQVKNYEAARGYTVQAIIALNKRGEKEPPAGISSNGTPRCTMGYAMVYWGAEHDRLKFRCPHVLGKTDCPLGTAACSDSNYGMVIKKEIAEDVRRYSNPHRDTRGWKQLYKERTTVERCNSRLKEYLVVNDLHVCGIQKVTAMAYLNAIVLVASALAMSKAAKVKKTA